MTMLTRLGLCLALLFALTSATFAQSWGRAYEEGLANAKAGKWLEAREAFRQAIAYRPEDASQPTFLPGSTTERKRWRDGSPYSPSFLAAYTLYRDALKKPQEEQAPPLRIAAAEFESLLEKGQTSKETFYFLDQIFERVDDTAKRAATMERFAKDGTRVKWRVDTELLTAEEIAAVAARGAPVTSNNKPGGEVVTAPGRVPALPTKFALVVGNSETGVSSLAVSHAAGDARRVRDALIANAGYLEENISLLANATAEQILTASRVLAARLPAGATVFVYFAGPGVNLSDADYLLGTDATSATETKGMVAKRELYQTFLAKDARIFAFFEANRPIVAGRYFGSEVPAAGSVAQAQATLPGEVVTSQIQNGRSTGVYTSALVDVLTDLKTNRIPILEFGWQVYYKIRRTGTGTVSRQTPTLPVLVNLTSDAKF
jgi:hypothetical protein